MRRGDASLGNNPLPRGYVGWVVVSELPGQDLGYRHAYRRLAFKQECSEFELGSSFLQSQCSYPLSSLPIPENTFKNYFLTFNYALAGKN